MSEENVEIVRSVLGPFEGIDVATIDWTSEAIRVILESALTPDAELMTLASGLASGVDDHYWGRDDFVHYFQDWFEPFSEYHIDWLDYIEAGDRVLVPSRQWGVGGASGAPAKLELTYLCELRIYVSCGTARSRDSSSTTPWKRPVRLLAGQTRRPGINITCGGFAA